MIRKPDTSEAVKASEEHDKVNEMFCSMSPDSRTGDCTPEQVEAKSNGSLLKKIIGIFKRD